MGFANCFKYMVDLVVKIGCACEYNNSSCLIIFNLNITSCVADGKIQFANELNQKQKETLNEFSVIIYEKK